MRFAHISDMHLGQTQYGRAEREDDMYDAFDEAVGISIKDKVDFAILAGDLFDKPVPSGRAIVSLGNSLKRLKDADIKAYFILGEHDVSRVRATPVAQVYHNLEVADYIGHGTPVMHKGTLLVGMDKKRRDEMPEHAEVMARADAAARAHTGRSVLVMHQGLMEVNKFAGEIAVSEMPGSFSYYAMGHLHDRHERNFEALGGPLAYPGSTEVTSVEGIRGTTKGFYEVDISGEEASMDWIALDTRPHVSFDTEYDSMGSRVAEIVAEIGRLKKSPVVRLNVSGPKVDVGAAHEQSAPIRDAALHLQVSADHTGGARDAGEVMGEKPAHMDTARARLAEKALGDASLADLALKSLLPLLSAGKMDEALQVIMDDYESFRKGRAA